MNDPPPVDEAQPPLKIRFSDLTETPVEALLPWLDKQNVDESRLSAAEQSWRRDGIVCLRKFIPDELTGPYIERRAAHPNPKGWLMGTPYMHIPELKNLALYPPLMVMLKSLIGEDMLLHLALTNWRSTGRAWHQDDYLNPEFVNCWYAAVWIALDDIHPDSGPFEYVPGSHHWPLLRREKVRSFLTHDELTQVNENGRLPWEARAERFMTPAIEAEIADRGGEIVPFIAAKGDVLIWHGRLIHRGALPVSPQRERRSLIVHYSGLHHRPDMIIREQDGNGHWYAVFYDPLRG